ncbi:MAG: L-rhamnose mutarotase [Pirellulales bacterium]
MIRRAFVMRLKKGCAREYKRRHDAIWPELTAELAAAGLFDYSIFLDEATGVLFAIQKLREDHTADQLVNCPVVQRWFDFMADILETEPDNTPRYSALQEMFHMD